MSTRTSLAAIALAATCATSLAAAACSDATEPARDLRIGVISDGAQPYVSLPDSVVAGQDFTIYILTFGGCMVRSHTQVEYSAPRTAIVTPWNRRLPGNCPDIGGTVEHTATLRFDTPGEARVSVRGWMIGGLDIAHYYVQVH